MEIGLWTGMRPNLAEVLSLEKVLDLYSQGEVHFVELEEGNLEEKSEREVENVALSFRERKIEIYSVHGPFWGDFTLSNTDGKIREKAIKALIGIIKKAKLVGAGVVVTHPGDEMSKGQKLEERLGLLRRGIEKVLPVAEKFRIKVALENMFDEGYGAPGSRASDLKEIVEDFNSPYLGICFDTGHSNLVNNVKEDFEVLREHIFTFHLADNDGCHDNHLQPPYGTIDWEEFYSLVKNSSYQGPLNLECSPWKHAEPGWVKKEVEWLFEGKILKIDFPKSAYLRCIRCGHFIFGDRENPVCYCNYPL